MRRSRLVHPPPPEGKPFLTTYQRRWLWHRGVSLPERSIIVEFRGSLVVYTANRGRPGLSVFPLQSYEAEPLRTAVAEWETLPGLEQP